MFWEESGKRVSSYVARLLYISTPPGDVARKMLADDAATLQHHRLASDYILLTVCCPGHVDNDAAKVWFTVEDTARRKSNDVARAAPLLKASPSDRKKSRDDLVLDTPEPSSASVDVPSTEAATPTAAGPAETDHRFAFLFLLKTPSKYWSTHYFPELDGVLYCTSVLCDGAVTSEKVVMFVFDQQTDAHCKVYLRGRLAQEHRVMSQAEAENLLEKVDAFNLCVGALNAQEYNSGFLTAGIREKLTLRQGTYFNNNCHGKVTTKGGQCIGCKYLRKVLLNRQSRVQRAPAKKLQSVSHKLRCLAQRNKRLVSRMSSLHADIQKMQTFNATLSEEVINERVSKLPQKQQECVKQCLAAAQVKEKGIRYTKMWILECIMMKMKSSRLYDHIRDNKILALPSKTTLKRYMSVYRSAFGFSKKVLEELKLKTQTMDHFKKHGGLLVDELKLSEHLCVKSTGHIEGFVDLGDYTTKADKGVQSDHGMLECCQTFSSTLGLGNSMQVVLEDSSVNRQLWVFGLP
ncbi:hypothetical protein HPB50_012187 [Hyalomma asiaticum]|uniref:Uncharacterized protein n=1 Tax=Hyalomma asiaticum TaxID=266040 RepID=A0ACB7RHS5_HYAAI|nr:hypothetical protein HPB50_012187 [Hyalomma asiaticum]